MITRGILLYLSRQKALRRWMETHSAARKLTRRFIAGDTLEDALAVSAQLQQEGIFAALDHLGENVTTLEEAAGSLTAYMTALEQIAARGLPATVSIKLTQFGLDLSETACLDNVRTLAAKARKSGSQVEIDMEGSAYTDRTLETATRVAQECRDIRCVVQAYLYRSAADIEHMNRHGIPVRLCKGAYNEPSKIAYPQKRDVDQNYVKLMKELLDHGAYPAIATHDARIIDQAMEYVTGRGISKERFEFQMLYGIRRDLQKRLTAAGYRLRLYVPYGVAWYPYFMRRLAERPANIWFLVKSGLR